MEKLNKSACAALGPPKSQGKLSLRESPLERWQGYPKILNVIRANNYKFERFQDINRYITALTYKGRFLRTPCRIGKVYVSRKHSDSQRSVTCQREKD